MTTQQMTVAQAIEQRRSIRAYTQQPVADDLIKKIFTQAQQSASNCNTQPWQVSVVSGDARKQLADLLVKEVMSGKKPGSSFQPGDHELTGVYRERQIDCAVQLYKTMNITREDKQERQELMLQNWQFFGAPHVAFLSMPKSMGEVNAIDIGIYLQSLMLLMTENGIACCPQGALAHFPDPVLALANIPADSGILCGLSFGYADEQAQINNTRLSRAPLQDNVTFIG